MIGTSIFEYVHEGDKDELAEFLGSKYVDYDAKNNSDSVSSNIGSPQYDSTLEYSNGNIWDIFLNSWKS